MQPREALFLAWWWPTAQGKVFFKI